MKITFLGTGSMVPTKKRNVVGHFLEYKGDGILVDCGEGTQRQMNIAGINRMRVNKILITHWHGDHVSGLIGLIMTLGNSDNPKPIQVFGPPGTKKNLQHLMNATLHNARVTIDVKELDPEGVEKFHETEDYYIECANMEHPAPTLAYRFVEKDQTRIDMDKARKYGLKEGPVIGKLKSGKPVKVKGKEVKPGDVNYVQKGKKVTWILDTAINDNCYEIANESDILICESTFHSREEDKATEYNHLTAAQAAKIAKKSGSKKLVLTHFSQRYPNVKELIKEAKEIFKNTYEAKDFMEIKP